MTFDGDGLDVAHERARVRQSQAKTCNRRQRYWDDGLYKIRLEL